MKQQHDDDTKIIMRQHHEQADHYDELLRVEKENLDTKSHECDLKDEKIRSLDSQLHLVEKSKDELAKQTEETINLLKATSGGYCKTIEENEGQFKILNDTIKKHMTEIDRIKREHTKEIENMEKEFQTQLQKQSAKFLDQVKKSNSQNDKKAKTANLHTTNLENEVGLQ